MTGFDRRRRQFLTASAAALGCALSAPAAAQSDFLSRGMENLGNVLGNGGTGDGGALSTPQIVSGLKEALRVGTERVVNQLGQAGGYLNDKAVHIPLPGFLGQAQSVLQAAGASGLLDDLEVRMNRAAEAAAPQARDIFVNAIGQMSLSDARGILNGPDDAATRYFQRTMTPELKTAFRPVVDRELEEAGAIRAFESVQSSYESVPFASGLGDSAKDRMVDHAVQGATDGVFHYLAKEEAAIRNDPARRTTDLLKTIFG